MADFELADIPVSTPVIKDNEYSPLIDQLVTLGLESGKEFRGAFADDDTAEVAKAKFQQAAKGRGVSGIVRKREPIEGSKAESGKVVLGLSIREKITRTRKPVVADSAE